MFFKVYHLSVFQTISVTVISVYIKIIVAVYLQIWIIQCKHNNMQWKKHTHIQIETRFIRVCFFWWKDFEQKMFKIFNLSWNCNSIYLYFQRWCFSYALGILKQGSNNILKQFLYFFIKNFWKKVDINLKSLNKINFRFQLKFGYFGLYLEIYITDPNFLFHI